MSPWKTQLYLFILHLFPVVLVMLHLCGLFFNGIWILDFFVNFMAPWLSHSKAVGCFCFNLKSFNIQKEKLLQKLLQLFFIFYSSWWKSNRRILFASPKSYITSKVKSITRCWYFVINCSYPICICKSIKCETFILLKYKSKMQSAFDISQQAFVCIPMYPHGTVQTPWQHKNCKVYI